MMENERSLDYAQTELTPTVGAAGMDSNRLTRGAEDEDFGSELVPLREARSRWV